MCLAIRVKWYTAVVWDGPHFSGWSSKKQKHMLSPVWLPSLAWTRVHSRTPGLIRNRFSNLWLIPSMIIYDLWTWKSNVEKYPDRTENVSKHVASRRTGIKKKKILWSFKTQIDVRWTSDTDLIGAEQELSNCHLFQKLSPSCDPAREKTETEKGIRMPAVCQSPLIIHGEQGNVLCVSSVWGNRVLNQSSALLLEPICHWGMKTLLWA